MTEDETRRLVERQDQLSSADAEVSEAVGELLATMKALHEMGLLRCERTGNPCGTDTLPRGWICGCMPCQAWGLATQPPEVMFGSRILDPERP